MSSVTRQDLVALLDRSRECDHRFKSKYDGGQFRNSASRAKPPATDAPIQALCAALPFRLPPSYIELFRISNGIAAFEWTFDRDTNDSSAEMGVVEFANDRVNARYRSLGDFLCASLERLEAWLAEG